MTTYMTPTQLQAEALKLQAGRGELASLENVTPGMLVVHPLGGVGQVLAHWPEGFPADQREIIVLFDNYAESTTVMQDELYVTEPKPKPGNAPAFARSLRNQVRINRRRAVHEVA